ncbi:DNA recombination protein RmuC [Chitinophaga sancti]|uniref:DNA recombination protein RmuC n=1 Tax=Chitinophaga sancti TaxID=1004 RepID=A0A1K1RNE9_9BACT|nr:DNA recombination protein RmuC [Chitinophaga sancti]WQD62633.1 DNA recombination protein RmuC [Chitinophaga sancti]WQG91744.1 DNA recombination protein RmuC [Chitinophaga sancti]SFW73340.1 DNA recombination protein RmuC [Chitinophaga sancti]
MEIIIIVVLSLAIIVWLLFTIHQHRTRIAVMEAQMGSGNQAVDLIKQEVQEKKALAEELNARMQILLQENIRLHSDAEAREIRLREQQNFIEQSNLQLRDAFSALSTEALKHNNSSFVTLAKAALETQLTDAKGDLEKRQQAIDSMVKPLSDSLQRFDENMRQLESSRQQQYGQINQFILGVQQSTEKLQKETHSLVSALKTSHIRGRYGEIALRRVVEFAGMTEHCDFSEQVSVNSDDGQLRPDMIIRLPEGKTIIVDSKVPLSAYMRAFETENEEERKVLLAQHAYAVKDHLKKLSAKAYWSQWKDSPDYVILYMQIESSFGAALQADPTLIEEGIRSKVVFATPTTLITLLRTVGFVWQQLHVAENIDEIRNAGIELYNRTGMLVKHFAAIGGSLTTAVGHYNSAVASLESRFMPQARRLQNLGPAVKTQLSDLKPVETAVRQLPEQLGDGENGEIPNEN